MTHARRRDAGRASRARAQGPVLIDFRVEQEDSVYPMVPAGADLHAMIRRPSPIAQTAATEIRAGAGCVKLSPRAQA